MVEERPKPKDNIDIEAIKAAADDFISFYEGEDYHEDRIIDNDNSLIESVLDAIYGPGWSKYVNSKDH